MANLRPQKIQSGSPSLKTMLIPAALGGLVGCLLTLFFSDSSASVDTAQQLQQQVQDLQQALAERDANLNKQQSWVSVSTQVSAPSKKTESCDSASPSVQKRRNLPTYNITNGSELLKALETASVNDRRSFSEKINDLLADNASPENIAVAMRSIADLANQPELMRDYELQTIYNSQSDPDLKLVAAKVLAQRGNSSLLDAQIAAAKSQLSSNTAKDRQTALEHLSKMHNVKAVEAIAPLLKDADINVKLDALLALKNTGNESHLSLVESLQTDPDVAVRSLATDVIGELKGLSSSARTQVSSQDITAAIPNIESL